METIPFNAIEYCKYGMKYRKRTRIWNNIADWKPKPLCNKDCNSMNGNKHKETAQRGPSGKKETWAGQQLFKQHELYMIPEQLVIELLDVIINNI